MNVNKQRGFFITGFETKCTSKVNNNHSPQEIMVFLSHIHLLHSKEVKAYSLSARRKKRHDK